MHHKNKYSSNLETIHSDNKTADSSGASASNTKLALIEKKISVTGKPRGFSRPAFVMTGMALCLGLSSCVVPYDSPGGNSVSVSTYRPGYTINSLPGGYRSESIMGSTYYYHNGSYYRQGSGGYMIVEAPRNSRYYDDYSRRHQIYSQERNYHQSPNRYDSGYGRAEVITRLPQGYRVLNHRGNTYYQAGDRYYLRQNNGYVITTSPY